MRIWIALSLALVVGLAAVGSVWAFSCPTLVKAANEAIAAAEPKANMGDDRQKARNAGMIEEAKARCNVIDIPGAATWISVALAMLPTTLKPIACCSSKFHRSPTSTTCWPNLPRYCAFSDNIRT